MKSLQRAALLSCSMLSAVAARAQTPGLATSTELGDVTVRAFPSISDPPAPGSAGYDTPSRGQLDAGQPTSVIGRGFIDRNVIPIQNYDSIIRYSPSVQNIEPVGPGLQQNFYQTIRGFSYKQFNSTFDGIVIPGTLTSFAPQSGAYFKAHDIGSVIVDRGPGTASTIGYATFGGTVAIQSKPPRDTFTVNPYASVGSFGTHLEGVQIDTGLLPQVGGGRGYADFQALDAGGYLTNTSTQQRNAFGRFDVNLDEHTTATFVALANSSYTHTPIGATLAQIRTLGVNYGLNRDPNSQAYSEYNTDHYTTDFEYVRIKSDLGDGWGIDDTPYTASYHHHGIVGLDPNGTTANLTSRYTANGMSLAGQVPGRQVHSDFRDFGNILRATKDTSIGQARAGFWFDYNSGGNYRYNVVLSQADRLYVRSGATPFDYNYKLSLTTYQPYVEYALTPLPGLVITPGLKYTAVVRGLDATINATTKLPAQFRETYDALQPSIEARYTFNPHLVGYAQVAQGFLAPPIGVLQTTKPQQLNPSQTTNYQIGGTWQRDEVTLSADGYYINFNNRITSQTVGGTAIYYNGGGATYRGLEAEGTVKLYPGLSLYANGTVNDAVYNHTGVRVANTPEKTAAIGPLYDRDGFSALLIAKWIGGQFGQDVGVNSVPIKSYATVDFAAGYTLPILNGRKLDFRLNVNNIIDDHHVIFNNGFAGDGVTPLYFTNPGRSVFFSISASL